MNQLNFLELPWEVLTEHMAISLQKELQREMGMTHVLFGKEAIAVACRIDNDDVIFWINDLNKYAVVHLTWSNKDLESYPKTLLFSLDELCVHCKRVSEFY